MRYYDEVLMQTRRVAFEKGLPRTPGLTVKKMFGCPCYKQDGKLFAFLVTDGLVLTQIDAKDRERLVAKFQGAAFHAGKKTVEAWVQLPFQSRNQLEDYLPSLLRGLRTITAGGMKTAKTRRS